MHTPHHSEHTLGVAAKLTLGKMTPAIKAALRGFTRGDRFEQWTVGKQRAALNTAICARDDLPQPSAVDLTSYLEFLRLG